MISDFSDSVVSAKHNFIREVNSSEIGGIEQRRTSSNVERKVTSKEQEEFQVVKERRDRDRSKRDLEVEGMKMLFTKNKALPNERKAKKATIMAAREVRTNFNN